MKWRSAPLLVLLFAGSAFAGDLPKYEPEKTCDAQARAGAGYSKANYVSCLKREQQAYDQLKATWSTIDEASQAHCDTVGRFAAPTGSYGQLLYCAKEEVAASGKAGDTKFRY